MPHHVPALPGLAGRVAIVTGANHGIGAATARLLAAQGAPVLLTYLRVDDADGALPDAYAANRARTADAVVEEIRAAGGTAEALECDLADPASAPMLFDVAEQRLGPVEILVNNASGWCADSFAAGPPAAGHAPHGRVTAATVDRIFAVDARAAALLVAEFADRHVRRGATWGRIVGLTSGGANGFPGEVSYGAAKAAQENYTMSAAVELAPYGVTANVVHPPVTDTGWVTDEVREFVGRSRELVHVATPDEVAAVVAWLASDLAELVSGNVLRLR